MGILNPNQYDHYEISERWQERNGDDPNSPATPPYEEFLRLGMSDDDAWEAFIKLLEEKGAEAQVKNNGFFTIRHRAVQAAMDDLKQHYKNVGKGPL